MNVPILLPSPLPVVLSMFSSVLLLLNVHFWFCFSPSPFVAQYTTGPLILCQMSPSFPRLSFVAVQKTAWSPKVPRAEEWVTFPSSKVSITVPHIPLPEFTVSASYFTRVYCISECLIFPYPAFTASYFTRVYCICECLIFPYPAFTASYFTRVYCICECLIFPYPAFTASYFTRIYCICECLIFPYPAFTASYFTRVYCISECLIFPYPAFTAS